MKVDNNEFNILLKFGITPVEFANYKELDDNNQVAYDVFMLSVGEFEVLANSILPEGYSCTVYRY